MNKLLYAMLTTLDRAHLPLASRHIARELISQGFELSERTVRYHLHRLEQQGLTAHHARRGSTITAKGRGELVASQTCERVGFIVNKINNLCFLADFDPITFNGRVILNITHVAEARAGEALRVMRPVLDSPYAFSNRVIVGRSAAGSNTPVSPPGMVAIGTICSMTLNGILLKAGIPVASRYGGIVEIENSVPRGFSAFISYEHSTVAPLETFMKSGMTSVLNTIASGTGAVLGSLREVPEACLPDVQKICVKLGRYGIGGKIMLGQPGQPLLGMPVPAGKAGMLVLGGLNPVAALRETGVLAESFSMAALCAYAAMFPVSASAQGHSAEASVFSAAPSDALPFEMPVRSSRYGSAFGELKQTML
jgi:hypothetical protein